MKTPDSLHTIFMEQKYIIDHIELNNNITCRNVYCNSIKCLLDNIGFSNIFYNVNNGMLFCLVKNEILHNVQI